MLASFLQVSPEKLSALLEDPDSVPELCAELPASASLGALLMSDAARERLDRLSPEVLSGAMQGLDPRLQEELAKRIGVVREALGSEEGRDAMLQLMAQRGLMGSERRPARASRLSLDKAWHGLHFLLCGQPEPTAGPLGSVILGGTEIGDDDLGYGPARYFEPSEVGEIAAALGRDGLEGELESRYAPGRM